MKHRETSIKTEIEHCVSFDARAIAQQVHDIVHGGSDDYTLRSEDDFFDFEETMLVRVLALQSLVTDYVRANYGSEVKVDVSFESFFSGSYYRHGKLFNGHTSPVQGAELVVTIEGTMDGNVHTWSTLACNVALDKLFEEHFGYRG